jgi:hypothetical protein
MAPDGIADPPRTLAAWLAWQRWCRAEGKFTKWAEVVRIFWPTEEQWTGEGPELIWFGPDHPFKGQAFCWRCVALAQGLTVGVIPHHTQTGTICFQAGRDPGTKDPVEDSRAPRVRFETDEGRTVFETPVNPLYVTRISAEGTPLGPRERIVARGFEAEAVDTGTLFWEPTAISIPLTDAQADAVYQFAMETDEPERTAQPDAEPVQADYRDTWPPSWTDDEASSPPGYPRWLSSDD